MNQRHQILRDVMEETGTSQSGLSRLSGVHQPSISQFLSGKVGLSDEQLARLLSSMGYRLEITRRPVKPTLSRSERRSWRLHRRISTKLNDSTLDEWKPTITQNLTRLREEITGQPHIRNLGRWEKQVSDGDISSLRRVLTGLDTDSIEMREVSPMLGVLSQEERGEVLGLSN